VRRLGREINHEKTRITTLTDGFDFIGYQFVKRRSPTTGKWSISIFPSKESQGKRRRRIKSFTKRRSPASPEECVRQINEAVRGWVQYYIHTNASQAFRALQRFINTRFRRYLTHRRTGRGCGWRRDPNRRLYAMGLIYIGSGLLRYTKAPVHAL
jgi:RNA-directed DNA polymerase